MQKLKVYTWRQQGSKIREGTELGVEDGVGRREQGIVETE